MATNLSGKGMTFCVIHYMRVEKKSSTQSELHSYQRRRISSKFQKINLPLLQNLLKVIIK
jgi:hypothetical protein